MFTQVVPIRRLLLVEKVGYYDSEILDFLPVYDENLGINHPNSIYGCDLIQIESGDYRIYLGMDCKLVGESSSIDYTYDNYDGFTYEMNFCLDFIDDKLTHALHNAKSVNMYYFKLKESAKDYYIEIESKFRKILKVDLEIRYDKTNITHRGLNQVVMGKQSINLTILTKD